MKKNKFSDYLLILLIKIPAIIMGYVSVVASSVDDPNGCTLSPDNQGCKLNRPIDFERKANKRNYIP
ncbi:MAG: hypothetical protein QNJ18_13760 [Xenococcaceae cyanobacterium MO_167.B52]|nr:hypothetical protein [Xenococcaceae cyanobacterium MO_167.B52]